MPFAGLHRIDDPRDNLEKARKWELLPFARAHGLTHITEQMPAKLIRLELRQRNLTRIQIPPRTLGAPSSPPANAPVVGIDEAADLARQFREQQAAPPPPPPAPRRQAKPQKPPRLVERPRQEINLLRDECKRLGIKMDRRDTKDVLKEKIAAHAKNTPEQRQ